MQKLVQYLVVGLLLAAPCLAATLSNKISSPIELLRTDQFGELDRNYSSIQKKYEMGNASTEELRNAFRAFYPTDRDLSAKYDEWIRKYPKSYVARLARAIYYKKVGYEERGGDYISATDPARLAKMDEAMRKSISDFGTSIEMSPKPFLSFFHMIDVSRSYAGDEYTRKMYNEAIRLDPSFVDTRRKYMVSLETKWGGSVEQMKSFLAECEDEHLAPFQLNALESMVYEDEGSELEKDGDHGGAESAFRRAIELGGADCDSCVALSLSKVLVEEHKDKDAIPFVSRYIADHASDNTAIAWRASLYLEARMMSEAVADLTTAATAGLSDAQNQLGVLYMSGVPGFMTINTEKGVAWLRKAAAQGNVQAQYNLPKAEQYIVDIHSATEAEKTRNNSADDP